MRQRESETEFRSRAPLSVCLLTACASWMCVYVCVCGVITARSPAWSPVEVSSVCLWHVVVVLTSPLLSSSLLLAHTGDNSNAVSLSTYQKLIVFIFNEHWLFLFSLAVSALSVLWTACLLLGACSKGKETSNRSAPVTITWHSVHVGVTVSHFYLAALLESAYISTLRVAWIKVGYLDGKVKSCWIIWRRHLQIICASTIAAETVCSNIRPRGFRHSPVVFWWKYAELVLHIYSTDYRLE